MKHSIHQLITFIFISILISCQNESPNAQVNLSDSKPAKNEPQFKRYHIKSGIVKYKTRINGKVMGSTIEGTGTQELYFKNWGAMELKKSDEKKITHINIFGQKKTEVEHTKTIDKLDNGKSYSVDEKNKVIYVRQDPAINMLKNMGQEDIAKAGENMLKSLGGKKTGTEKVIGYTCDVWQIPGGKQWIYKGVPLKIQMSLMGITTTNEATEAKFNVPVPDKYFVLPDYPVQQMPGFKNDPNRTKDMKQRDEKLRKMSFKQYKEMLQKNDPKTFKNMSENDLKMSYKLMKKIADNGK